MRLGDDKIIPIDVRIIAATNRNLEQLTEKGGFRNDLYWRLNVLYLYIPPLRERKKDILPLLNRMLSENKECTSKLKLTHECKVFLQSYSWPGNIRELKNFCERASAICDDSEISIDLAISLLNVKSKSTNEFPLGNLKTVLDDPMRLQEFIKSKKNLSEAAECLHIHRTTLWRHLKRVSS